MIYGVSFALSGFTLHPWLSLVELCFFLSAIYAVAMSAWKRSKIRQRNMPTSWQVMPVRFATLAPPWVVAKLRFISSITRTWTRGRGSARYAPVVFAFVLCVVWLGFAYSTKPKIERLTSVQILERVNAYDFRYQIVDPDTREWNEFVWKGCHDYVPTWEIRAGATLLWIKYVEDKTQSCQEVGWDNLGYKLWRDQNDNPIIATFAGQTTASRPRETAH